MAVVTKGGAEKRVTAENDEQAFYKYLLAWAVFLALCVAITKTEVGQRIVYYCLWLILLFLLVTQYQWIDTVLKPLETPNSAKGT